MADTFPSDPAQAANIAYDAYGDEAGWVNWQKLPMPKWADLPENIQRYWMAAVKKMYQLAANTPCTSCGDTIAKIEDGHPFCNDGGCLLGKPSST